MAQLHFLFVCSIIIYKKQKILPLIYTVITQQIKLHHTILVGYLEIKLTINKVCPKFCNPMPLIEKAIKIVWLC